MTSQGANRSTVWAVLNKWCLRIKRMVMIDVNQIHNWHTLCMQAHTFMYDHFSLGRNNFSLISVLKKWSILFIYLFIYFFAHLYGYVRCEPNSQLTYALQTNTYMHDPSSLARSNFLNTCFEKLIDFILFFFCSPLFHILDCHLLRVPGPRLEARNLPQVCPRNLSTKWKHVTIRVFSIHLIEVKFLNLNSWFFFYKKIYFSHISSKSVFFENNLRLYYGISS